MGADLVSFELGDGVLEITEHGAARLRVRLESQRDGGPVGRDIAQYLLDAGRGVQVGGCAVRPYDDETIVARFWTPSSDLNGCAARLSQNDCFEKSDTVVFR